MKQNIPCSNRSCKNCLKGTSIAVNSDILCRERGAVSSDYVCSRHRYIPEPKTYKEMNLKCIECENFIINTKNPKEKSKMGLCQLFSVRQFDGTQKKACSKFVKRRESEVS